MADTMSGIVLRDSEMTYAEGAKQILNAKAEFEAATKAIMDIAAKLPEHIKTGESYANADAMGPITPAWAKTAELLTNAKPSLDAFASQLDAAHAAFVAMSKALDR